MKHFIRKTVVLAAVGATAVFVRQTMASQAAISDRDFTAEMNQVGETIGYEVRQAKPGFARSSAPAREADEGGTRFSGFYPYKIVMYRDGGTIVVEGLLNKSVSATFRSDRRINSPTFGQFFVSEKWFNRPAEPERKMTPSEMKGLSQALKRHLADDPNDRDRNLYEEFIKRLTPPPPSPAPSPL